MEPKNKLVVPEKPKMCPRTAPSRITQKKEFKSFYADCDDILVIVCALLTDGYNRISLTKSADSLHRDIICVRRRYKTEGLSFAAKTLPRLFQDLLNYLEFGTSSYPGWKLAKGREYPAFMQRLFAEVYDEKTSEADRAKCIDSMYQICAAFKKLKGPYRNSVLRKQLADFVETDIELRYNEFMSDGDLRQIRIMCRDFITAFIKGLDPELPDQGFLPRPGPGATNSPTEKHVRFRPHVLYTQLNDEFPYEEWFYSHPWDLVTGIHKHPFRLKTEEMPTSRFKFVPKTYGKPRGICIEQLETQYLQQALKTVLYKRIEEHPLTKGYINLFDQSVNGGLALRSSLDGYFATIDMKEASDRISRDLVSYLFGGNELFLRKLLALSTRIVDLPDEIRFITEFPTAKFAPMGSALCFPVMSLVHLFLVRAICCHIGRKDLIWDVYVFGDDIIVPSEVVEEVFTYLPKFGMRLNRDKSFYKSRFRESCGLHAYNGVEITPVYFKNIPTTSSTVSEFISCLQCEGHLYSKGFFETSKVLRSLILRESDRFGFKERYVTNEHTIPGFIREDVRLEMPESGFRRRWNKGLGCYEYKVLQFVPVLDELPPLPQDEGLLRWHLTGAETELSVDASGGWTLRGVSGSTIDFKTRWRWLPESALYPLPPLNKVGVNLGRKSTHCRTLPRHRGKLDFARDYLYQLALVGRV